MKKQTTAHFVYCLHTSKETTDKICFILQILAH